MRRQPFLGLCIMMAILIITIITSADAVTYSYSVPDGPNITTSNTSRRTLDASAQYPAYAGNVTMLTISGISISQTWQGYYGNVTGMINLENGANEVFYSWDLVYPTGEVYASEAASINWTAENLDCYQFDMGRESVTYLSLPEYEGWVEAQPAYDGFELTETSPDGIDETFTNATNVGHTSFYAGVKFFNGSTSGGHVACPSTRTYNASGVAGTFEEAIIYATSNQRPVYAAIILPYGGKGFDGRTWNFQMLVPEKGRGGDTSTTPYYFYMELE